MSAEGHICIPSFPFSCKCQPLKPSRSYNGEPRTKRGMPFTLFAVIIRLWQRCLDTKIKWNWDVRVLFFLYLNLQLAAPQGFVGDSFNSSAFKEERKCVFDFFCWEELHSLWSRNNHSLENWIWRTCKTHWSNFVSKLLVPAAPAAMKIWATDSFAHFLNYNKTHTALEISPLLQLCQERKKKKNLHCYNLSFSPLFSRCHYTEKAHRLCDR